MTNIPAAADIPAPRADASKWTAFLLSLAVPGAGQLWAKSPWCAAWFAAAGMAVAAWMTLAASGATSSGPWAAMQFASLAALAIASAEHARRLMESRPPSKNRLVRRTRVESGFRGRAVRVRIELDLIVGADRAWQAASDLPRFLTIDPFHERVLLAQEPPAAGTELLLVHNVCGRRFSRQGRILKWRDVAACPQVARSLRAEERNRGYAFSDLSLGDRQGGFPHVFFIHAERRGEESRIVIEVKGRWSSRLVPPFAGRLWLHLVGREHARLLKKGLA